MNCTAHLWTYIHIIHSSKLKVKVVNPIIKDYKLSAFGDVPSPTNHDGFY